ncbi:conjugal transfer protein TraD [Mesorhizobium sp. ORM8.1]
MRAWQVERRKRTRHLIELGGLVVKAGIVELTHDDRAIIYGALLWIAAKLQSDEGEHARNLWAAKGKQAFDAERHENERISEPSGSCATPQSQGRCLERD